MQRQATATTTETGVTPVSARGDAALHTLIENDAHALNEAHKQRLQKLVQKLANATELFFAERALLSGQNEFLAQIHTEAKAPGATKANIIGTSRVMTHADLEKARAECATKDAEQRRSERQNE